MYRKIFIRAVKITNFKCFKDEFIISFNKGLNIIVGDNEAGKSTILEAIHLALSGMLNGRYLKNEINQYLFNVETVRNYLDGIKNRNYLTPPEITIEVFFGGDDLPIFEGDGNSFRRKASGISLKIGFNENFRAEYEEFVRAEEIVALPIEYYEMTWTSFARENITVRNIPLKSAFIDSANSRFKSGSDVNITSIIKDYLEPKEIIAILQAHRKMQDTFASDETVQNINEKLNGVINLSSKSISVAVDLSTKNSWEGSLAAFFDEIPFQQIGKGEQCIIKTKIALNHKKAEEANVILLEEPENHLSHSKLNQLLCGIKEFIEQKQIIISTHSSFVANKLGIDSLILLNHRKLLRLHELQLETKSFFEKLSGYDTLRLVLCKKAILVEGDSDELVVQRAFMDNNENRLPIECEIEVISVGTAFLRFLEIAKHLNKNVTVITDNDGDVEAVNSKYSDFLTPDSNIKICFDDIMDIPENAVANFNYNTLEPKILKANSLEVLNRILNKSFTEDQKLLNYMQKNKTECALKIFSSKEKIDYPAYIIDGISE